MIVKDCPPLRVHMCTNGKIDEKLKMKNRKAALTFIDDLL